MFMLLLWKRLSVSWNGCYCSQSGVGYCNSWLAGLGQHGNTSLMFVSAVEKADWLPVLWSSCMGSTKQAWFFFSSAILHCQLMSDSVIEYSCFRLFFNKCVRNCVFPVQTSFCYSIFAYAFNLSGCLCIICLCSYWYFQLLLNYYC